MSDGPNRIGYAVVGLALGGLLVYGAMRMMGGRAEDDERPPIIVRGGSLIFQSGEDSPGVPWWEDNAGEWKQFQEQGQATRVYDLTFEPNSCNPRTTPEFTVVYDPDGEGSVYGEEKFVVARLPRKPGGQGTNGPAVVGTSLDNSNARPNPKLTRLGSSATIIRVEGPGGQVLCSNPTKVTALPKK